MAVNIQVYGSALLTSDASGDATATIECAPGILIGVLVVNVAATKPDDNWDLTLANSVNSVTHNLLVDATVTQTGAALYMPSIEGNLGSDGSAQTLTELRIPTWGNISVTGANMGASNNAYVYVMIQH